MARQGDEIHFAGSRQRLFTRGKKRPVEPLRLTGFWLFLSLALLILLPTGCLTRPAIPTAVPLPPTEALALTDPQPTRLPATLHPPAPTSLPATLLPPTLHPPSSTLHPPAPAPPTPSRSTYRFTVDFDYAWHRLVVSQTVHYVNKTTVSLNELLFVVEPNRWPDAFQPVELTWEDGTAVDNAVLADARLRVPLPASLDAGEKVVLTLRYDLNLPEQSFRFGHIPRQTNLGDWYPFIPPYDPVQGWLAYEPTAAGEHLVYGLADFQVQIRPVGEETDYLIAGPGFVGQRDGRYHYRLENARGFAWSASPEYVVTRRQVGETTVVGYGFPEHREAGQAALEATAAALLLYGDLYGPYGRETLVVVEALFADGMEYDGLYFLDEVFYATYGGDPAGYLTAIAVHETVHQWFYGQVGNNQALEPWLDEALCIYNELLYYETYHPELVDWWWEYRVLRFWPTGPVNGSIYDYDGFRPYVNAVYLHGALFLDALRDRVGDDAFRSFLQAYAAQGHSSLMTATDFFTLLEAHSERDFSGVIADYFD